MNSHFSVGIKKLVFNDICFCCCCCSVKQPLKLVYMIFLWELK